MSGFSLLSSYMWGHAIDGISSSEDLVLALGPQDPYNLRLEKAASAIDVRHRSVTSAIWDVPVGRPGRLFGNNSVVRALLGNWQVAGIFVAQTGLPVNPGVSRPVSAGLSLRPDVLRGPHLPKSRRTVDRWFDPSAFSVPPVGKIGNAGRNILRAPGLVNLDFLLARSFRLAEAIRLDFRGELFNALNQTHLGAPNATTDQPQAGAITSVLAPPRQIQFGLKLVF